MDGGDLSAGDFGRTRDGLNMDCQISQIDSGDQLAGDIGRYVNGGMWVVESWLSGYDGYREVKQRGR